MSIPPGILGPPGGQDSDSNDESSRGLETRIVKILAAGPFLSERNPSEYESPVPEYFVVVKFEGGLPNLIRGLSRDSYYELLQSYGLEIFSAPSPKAEVSAGSRLEGRFAVLVSLDQQGVYGIIPAPELDSVRENPFIKALFGQPAYYN